MQGFVREYTMEEALRSPGPDADGSFEFDGSTPQHQPEQRGVRTAVVPNDEPDGAVEVQASSSQQVAGPGQTSGDDMALLDHFPSHMQQQLLQLASDAGMSLYELLHDYISDVPSSSSPLTAGVTMGSGGVSGLQPASMGLPVMPTGHTLGPAVLQAYFEYHQHDQQQRGYSADPEAGGATVSHPAAAVSSRAGSNGKGRRLVVMGPLYLASKGTQQEGSSHGALTSQQAAVWQPTC
jgi:hypothetical protein